MHYPRSLAVTYQTSVDQLSGPAKEFFSVFLLRSRSNSVLRPRKRTRPDRRPRPPRRTGEPQSFPTRCRRQRLHPPPPSSGNNSSTAACPLSSPPHRVHLDQRHIPGPDRRLSSLANRCPSKPPTPTQSPFTALHVKSAGQAAS